MYINPVVTVALMSGPVAGLCSDCTEDSEWESRGGDSEDDRAEQVKEQQASRGLRRSKRFVRRPSVQSETKYIELMVVNDNEMVRGNYHFSMNYMQV